MYLCSLQVFFEGVQNRVATGVKPEEVGFQLAFSKQELRKVIKEYPVKEVRSKVNKESSIKGKAKVIKEHLVKEVTELRSIKMQV